jgi:hypothetical protein
MQQRRIVQLKAPGRKVPGEDETVAYETPECALSTLTVRRYEASEETSSNALKGTGYNDIVLNTHLSP